MILFVCVVFDYYQDLLKDIEDVLKMTAQNKVLALEAESPEEDLSH